MHPEFSPIEANELWQFPMHYPIKIIGDTHPDFVPHIHTLVLEHFPTFDLSTIEILPSRTGKYTSIRLKMYFESANEVNAIYQALRSVPFIKTVL